MTELQDANWAKVEAEVRVNAQRLFWQAKLIRGDRLPLREVWNIAQRAIEDFRNADVNDYPKTETSKFVDSAEAWLVRNQGKIWKLAQEEERSER